MEEYCHSEASYPYKIYLIAKDLNFGILKNKDAYTKLRGTMINWEKTLAP